MLSMVLAAAQTHVACRSDHNDMYLRAAYAKNMHDKNDKEGSAGVIYMEANAERVVGSARTRFILEPVDPQKHQVHVRCAYNKKYWAPQEVTMGGSGGSHWIIGTAHQPDDEDLSKSSCTVFELVVHDGNTNTFRFYHPGLRKYARIVADKGKNSLQLQDEGSVPRDGDRRSDTFHVIVVSEYKELPKYVIFKGDNGRYLQPEQFVPPGTPLETQKDPRFWRQLPIYLRFGQNERSDPSALHTTYTNDQGQVRIKSESIRRFWAHVDDFVEGKSREDNFNDKSTLFKVLPWKDFTALRNMGTNKFCKRLTSYGTIHYFWEYLNTPLKESCLSAVAETIEDPCAQLHVEEPISDRKIFDIELHMHEARVYGMHVVKVENHPPHPNTSSSVDTFSFENENVTTLEGKWETSVSMKRSEDYKAMVSLGAEMPLPKIGDGKLSMGLESSSSVSTETVSSHNEAAYERKSVTTKINQVFHVDPKTLLTVTVVEKKYNCDVPYSYKQTDLRFNGDQETTTHDDGIYSFTINSFDVTSKSERLE